MGKRPRRRRFIITWRGDVCDYKNLSSRFSHSTQAAAEEHLEAQRKINAQGVGE